MMILDEIRNRARHIIGPLMGACAVLYFAYHTVQGDRGLLAWWRLHHEIRLAEEELARVSVQRQALEHRVTLLHPASLDRDMLEERARLVLNLGHAHEIVVFERVH